MSVASGYSHSQLVYQELLHLSWSSPLNGNVVASHYTILLPVSEPAAGDERKKSILFKFPWYLLAMSAVNTFVATKVLHSVLGQFFLGTLLPIV